MLEGQQLVAMLKEGNTLAFNKIYTHLWENLFLSAYKVLKDEAVSKDVVQEVFLDLWDKKNEAFIDQIEPYLYQAVRYKVLMHIRHGKYQEIHQKMVNKLNFDNSTEDHINYTELLTSYENGLANMPERCREVFYMSRHQNFSNQEIASALNVSVRTVEKHISNALKYLKFLKETTPSFLVVISQVLERWQP